MSHLTDMEELTASIQNAQIKDYMEEAMACYMAGAYRACVVLTFTALFDDVVSKLGELGRVNKKARSMHEDVVKKRGDQEVFESYLIDQLKAQALLPALDANFLEVLRTLRNKAAHPSGHHASAEEARFVFFEAISRFLSKPILSTTQLADTVLAGLGSKNLFPSAQISDIAKVTQKELQNIHVETLPYLLSKLLEKCLSTDTTVKMNASWMLNGIARNADAAAIPILRKYCVDQIAAKTEYSSVVRAVMCANGSLFDGLDVVTYGRIAALVTTRINDIDVTEAEQSKFSHPASLFISLLTKAGEALVISKLGIQLKAYLDKSPYGAYFTTNALRFPTIKAQLIDKLQENASSNDFATANEFARRLGDTDKLLGDSVTQSDAFQLLVGVLKAANWGAFSSMDVRSSRFASAPKLRSAARSYWAADQAGAAMKAQTILNVGAADIANELSLLLTDVPPAAPVAP